MNKETKVVPLKRKQKTPRGNLKRFTDAFFNYYCEKYDPDPETKAKLTAALVSMTHYWKNTDEYHAIHNGELLCENLFRKEREAGR